MPASRRSCWTTFFIATTLDDPDIVEMFTDSDNNTKHFSEEFASGSALLLPQRKFPVYLKACQYLLHSGDFHKLIVRAVHIQKNSEKVF